MKYFLAISLVLVFNSAKANRTDTLPSYSTIVQQLQAVNVTDFIGKPVDSLLAQLPSGIVSMKILPSFALKRATYLFVNYDDDAGVVIAVLNFSHMTPEFSSTGFPTQHWNLDLFKKENISFVVMYNGSCINGCDNQERIN